MNDAQAAPGASLIPESTDLITGIHFVLIVLFAVAAIAIILIGMRRKRRRKRAEQVVEARIEQAGDTSAAAPPSTSAPLAPPPAADDRNPVPLADTPVAAASSDQAGPTPEAISIPSGDDPARGPVTQLKGLGPKVAARLAELGITTVGDLAALSDADAQRLDADLGPFAGRLARDRWVEQARLLAAGDRAGFEAVFGKL